jgi:hypothetical protein
VLVAAVTSPALAQFETRSSFPVPGVSYSVAVGDFNGDGIPDVAVGDDGGSGSVKILLGSGDGIFRLGSTYSVDVLFSAATASLRKNGILDLVFGGGNDQVYVMLGNGNGTFQAAVAYPTSAFSYMVALGDFTSHGNLDIVAVGGTNSQGEDCNCIEVLPGNGDGTFGSAITEPLPYGMTAYAIAVGDFSNDGKLDVAVEGEAFPSYEVAILLGNGDGTFTADGYYPLAEGGSIATGYFTADKKKLDLAAMSYGSVAVLLGNGDGTFQQPVTYDAGLSSWVTAQDFNGDGKVDLAASGEGPGPQYQPGVTVLDGNGDGTFQTPGTFYPAGKLPQFVASSDLNEDRKPDLVLVDQLAGQVITLLNTGVVSFSPTTPLNFEKQAVGTTSAPQSVTLTNTGTTELKIQSIKASAGFSVTSTCGERVAAGANCAISATFSPTKQGAVQGTISIIDSASSKPQVIELLGTGT